MKNFNWLITVDLHNMNDTIRRVCFRYKVFSFQFTAIKSYDRFHNILRLFDVLKNFPFTTSETLRDYRL